MTGTPTSERAIVVFSDVFGPRYGFHRSICDELADRTSSFVLMPDLFRGILSQDAYDERWQMVGKVFE